MVIAVFGATGKVGSLVVAELLKRGHFVQAYVHGNSVFDNNRKLKIIKGDIKDPVSVIAAVKGSDAVISALGSWGTATKDILTTGMTNIIPAMKVAKTKRIISLTGHDARATGDKLGLIHRLTHPVLRLAAGKILFDGEEHIRLLERSELNWTVIRSPIMKNGHSVNYSFPIKRPLPLARINRQAVVQALADLAESQNKVKSSPFIRQQ